jgi:hypothetical protein
MSELEELKGFSNYLINKEGQVWSKYFKRFIKPHTNTKGYFCVYICDDNKKQSNFSVHRLLGLQFIDNPNNLPIIDHIDGNRKNNCLDNLRWVDAMTNSNNRIKRGSIYQDKDYWRAKICINGKKYTKASKSKEVVEEWLASIL